MQLYFSGLAKNNQLPSFDKLLEDALVVYQRYASLNAYERALSKCSASTPDPIMAIPTGKAWVPPKDSTSNEAHPKLLRKEEGFDGDRTLANSILFLHEYSTWVELAHVTPEGDIGHIWEIIKVCSIHSFGSRYQLRCLDLYFLVRWI